jgi:polyisoprenoid-binding protein YceI
MTTFTKQIAAGLAAICLIVSSLSAQRTTYSVDAAQSKLQITVGKSGLLSMVGHNHLIDASDISGSVQYDAADISHDAVTFSVAVSSLRVVDPGESDSSRQQVQATMLGPAVLDAKQFETITFSTTAVSQAKSLSEGWQSLDLTGLLKLHGVEREIHVPVQLRLDGDVLHARGQATVRQSDFGITPVTAVGGTVRVKDEVKISFEIVATTSRRTRPERSGS